MNDIKSIDINMNNMNMCMNNMSNMNMCMNNMSMMNNMNFGMNNMKNIMMNMNTMDNTFKMNNMFNMNYMDNMNNMNKLNQILGRNNNSEVNYNFSPLNNMNYIHSSSNEKPVITGKCLKPLTIEETNEITEQMKYCICKVNEGNGFFCIIPFKDQKLKVLITNSLNSIVEKKQIEINFNDKTKNKSIKLDKNNRTIYKSDKYDIVIIEIKNSDGIGNFLEFDNILNYNSFLEILFSNSIYILQNSSVSYGIIEEFNDLEIKHSCSVGILGCPILNLNNKKVIGIQVSKPNNFNIDYNKGICLKNPLNEYIKKYIKENNDINLIENKTKNNCNEITIKLKIDKLSDSNKYIYYLNNPEVEANYNGKNSIDSLKELNDENVEVFINNIQHKYQRYFIPLKEGIYDIKLKFKKKLNDCSCMFKYCNKIINIDLSSFDSSGVTDMSAMFLGCSELLNIDLSNLNTKNVNDMSYMFSQCYKLKKINLSSFDTKKVINMKLMFSECYDLENIDLSYFNTENVTNIQGMFSYCGALKNLNLSSFYIKKGVEMRNLFGGSSNITNLDLSSFEIGDIYNFIDPIFLPNLEELIIKKKLYNKINEEKVDFLNQFKNLNIIII